VLTSSTWNAFKDEEDELESAMNIQDEPQEEEVIVQKMPRGRCTSATQAKKKKKKEEESMLKHSRKMMLKESANIFVTAMPPQESVNMVKGWRREDRWTQVRSVMDSGCGASVAPPGMCPAYPIQESEGSRAGQEFVSASEDKLPNLGEQTLSAVLQDSSETSVRY